MYRIHAVSVRIPEVSSIRPGSMRFLRPLLRLVSGAKATGAVLRLTGVLLCCRRHGWCRAVRIAVMLNAAIVPPAVEIAKRIGCSCECKLPSSREAYGCSGGPTPSYHLWWCEPWHAKLSHCSPLCT